MKFPKVYKDFKNALRSEEARQIESAFLIIVGTILLIAFVVSCELVSADELDEKTAVHCILGEARGEGYQSMVAHAEVLRFRGSTKGVYGCKADFSGEMDYLRSTGILTQAKAAWEASKTSNLTKGAKYWGSLVVDKAWIAKMESYGWVKTAVIGNTAFYRGDK